VVFWLWLAGCPKNPYSLLALISIVCAPAQLANPLVWKRCEITSIPPQDFAFEPDEQRMRKAAHVMVTSLAGSLALVGSREPMRNMLAVQLRPLLAENIPGIEEQVWACCTQHA
jgi:hypothetical protein